MVSCAQSGRLSVMETSRSSKIFRAAGLQTKGWLASALEYVVLGAFDGNIELMFVASPNSDECTGDMVGLMEGGASFEEGTEVSGGQSGNLSMNETSRSCNVSSAPGLQK